MGVRCGFWRNFDNIFSLNQILDLPLTRHPILRTKILGPLPSYFPRTPFSSQWLWRNFVRCEYFFRKHRVGIQTLNYFSIKIIPYSTEFLKILVPTLVCDMGKILLSYHTGKPCTFKVERISSKVWISVKFELVELWIIEVLL